MQDIEAAVFALIATRPMRSYEVRNELTGRGFTAGKVRDAVAHGTVSSQGHPKGTIGSAWVDHPGYRGYQLSKIALYAET